MDKIEAFLSCSFKAEDEPVNRLFLELCAALGIRCSNIDSGDLVVPAEVARRELERQSILIAVCVRRDRKANGLFDMPVAVRNEIGIAYGMKRKIQLFVEEGVELGGFELQFGTHVVFRREALLEPAVLRTIVKTLHSNRDSILTLEGVNRSPDEGTRSAYVRVKNYFDGTRNGDGSWCVELHRKALFSEGSVPFVKTGFWLEDYNLVPEDGAAFTFSAELFSAKGVDRIELTIRRRDVRGVNVTLQFIPAPQEGDWVEYQTTARSPYVIPRCMAETNPDHAIRLGDKVYRAYDGLIPVTATEILRIEHWFPNRLGLTQKGIRPFCSSYTNEFDYQDLYETRRIRHECESLKGCLVSTIEVNRPKPDHMYGIAWNPVD